MKIVTIIGARPQIIKAAAISRAISNNFQRRITELIVHTGQHYDSNMSAVFIKQLGIPQPDFNLECGSGNHGEQTAKMLSGIERIIVAEKPDAVVVYGDTNSTVAGGLAASKLHVPLVHVEAGLRSFNKSMPEEINRILCDHMSTLLFTPTQEGLKNLDREGFDLSRKAPFTIDRPGIFHCGDVMYDNSMHFSKVSDEKSTILKDLGLRKNAFILATVHRPSNTDSPEVLASVIQGLLECARKSDQPIVFPVHPRTRESLEKLMADDQSSSLQDLLRVCPPAGFLDMIALEKNCSLIATDSGGVQKEAYFFEKPCIILREETEWVELAENGNAILAGANAKQIQHAFGKLTDPGRNFTFPRFYGDGKAAEFICGEILTHLG